MTSVAAHRPWTSPTLRNALVVRQGIAWANYVGAIRLVFRPVVVTLVIAAAAAMWPAPAHADGLGEPRGSVASGGSPLSGGVIGGNGALSTTIAGIGQSFCPMLVQPGGKLVSMATQLSGHDGVAPTIAGFVARAAIQSQCPSWMTSLANGEMPAGLQALTSMAGPALQLPGAAPASAGPLSQLGTTPAAPGLQIPAL